MASGYRVACSNIPGKIVRHTDPFRLPRFLVATGICLNSKLVCLSGSTTRPMRFNIREIDVSTWSKRGKLCIYHEDFGDR